MSDYKNSGDKSSGDKSAGETNLQQLLKTMSPVLSQQEYVFVTFENSQHTDHVRLEPVATVMEKEGLTMVVVKNHADANSLQYTGVFRRITLEVHSSLEAVGLTAAFSNKLAQHGISANVIAGFYHDHIFVQREFAENAMSALGEFSDHSAES